jgi:hypothetical protein
MMGYVKCVVKKSPNIIFLICTHKKHIFFELEPYDLQAIFKNIYIYIYIYINVPIESPITLSYTIFASKLHM